MMLHILFSVAIFSISLITCGQLPKLDQFKKNKVEQKPTMYKLPTNPLIISATKSNELWVVYSDRNDNNIYFDEKSSKAISKINFLDSFFVTEISGDMFELIKYNSKIVKPSGEITNPDKIEYIGWINKSNLLLNDHSFVDPLSKFPYKYVTLLNGTNLFPNTFNYYNESYIKIFSDPELKTILTNQKLNLNEVVYVFKQNKDQVLIGKKNQIETNNTKEIIIGWTHINFVQKWSTRLSIENIKTESDTIHSYLFPAKNHAINFENNSLTAIPLQPAECNTFENFWNKNPVYKTETIFKNNNHYLLMETGVIINPFENSQAYIYSSNGSKITYSNICKIHTDSKKTNIIFAFNFDVDTKEYYTSLIETFQELDIYFSIQKSGTYSFSLVNLSDNTFNTILTVDNFNQLFPKAIDLIKENVHVKKSASQTGILNGLTTSSTYFKNHVGENNIMLLFSTQGDYNVGDNAYKNKFEKSIIDLTNSNAKVIMYQPYSSNGVGYSNFIPQSKNILKKYADKSITTKSSLQISNTETTYSNTFKALETGISNIYCLDSPQNASSQGFIVFPTIASKVDKKTISKTLDSLFYQIKYDREITLENIQSTFNSSSIFNSRKNPCFERYYNMFNMLPRNLEIECKNINFNYFALGYTISPYEPLSTKKYYQQHLLLSEDEYQELYSLFKSLKIDALLIEPTEVNKDATLKALKTGMNKRAIITDRKYSHATLMDFIFETCGYYTYTPILNKCPINYSPNSTSITKDEYFVMLARLKKSFDLFYQIQYNPNHSFYSNGIKYYWINETLLP